MRLKMSISKYQKKEAPEKYYLPYLLTEEKKSRNCICKKKSTNTLLRKQICTITYYI